MRSSLLNRVIRKFELLKYNIAFIDITQKDIVNKKPFQYHFLQHNYENWFADPFILDVTDHHIILLCEEYDYKRWKGHISKLIVDRNSKKLLSKDPVLILDTHLSYPAILRKDNEVFVCPENGSSGEFICYKLQNDTLVKNKIILNVPLADATITDFFGDRYLFCTKLSECSGCNLTIYHEIEQDKWEFYQTVHFSENIARMAGDFFKIGETVYRPAQDCNKCYGHGTLIQKVDLIDGKFEFTEVTRYFSPDKRMSHGIHTLNSYKGITVVDMEGYEWPILARIAKILRWISNYK